jgi:hypothetical protein
MKMSIELNDQNAILRWMRIVAGSLGAITGAWALLAHPRDFLAGVVQISTAVFFIFMKFRKPNEPFLEYIIKPRAVITFVSVLIMMSCSIAGLVRQFR